VIDRSISTRKGLILRDIYVGARQGHRSECITPGGRPDVCLRTVGEAYRHMQSPPHRGEIVIRIA
jgi:hypothetical protein